MANYIYNSLEEGEHIILNGRLHWTSIAGYLITTWILVIAALGLMVWAYVGEKPNLLWVGGVALFVAFIVYVYGRVLRTRSEFAVTEGRFIQKDGIFNIQMTERSRSSRSRPSTSIRLSGNACSAPDA